MTSLCMPELSESAFVILQTAVTHARDYQIQSVKVLRNHLAALYPGCQTDVDQAIAYWSASIRRRGRPE